MKRSEDPRTRKITDRQRERYVDSGVAQEYIDYLEERMDKGQAEHGNDYKYHNCIGEIKPECADLFGWFVMCAGYKFRLPQEVQDFWFDACLQVYKQLKDLDAICELANIEQEPVVLRDKLREYIEEDNY